MKETVHQQALLHPFSIITEVMVILSKFCGRKYLVLIIKMRCCK